MTSSPNQFGRVLAELLIRSGYVRKNSNPDWIRLVAELDDVKYETLRKAVADERPVSEALMRRVARALNVDPTIFVEHRLLQARRELDPNQVGWARAVAALTSWERSQS